MKIIATVRTRDEEANIEWFCMSYQWADKILVMDGGSIDDTVSIAKRMPKTEVRHFEERAKMENNRWRNPSGKHINSLIDWAAEEKADWILFDDCDCTPNKHLQKNGRNLLENSKHDMVYAVRLYLWREGKHFLKMAQPILKGRWETSLWGWKRSTGMRFGEETPHLHHFSLHPKPEERLDIFPPGCLLHRPWQTEEMIKKKMDFYRDSGQHPTITHPLKFAGGLAELPEWAIE